METLQTIETKINELIEQNKNAISQTKEELTKSYKVIEKANADILTAQKEINAEKYTEAKTDLWTAENTRDFYEERLRTLTQEPLVTYEEFHNMVNNLENLANEEQRTYFEPLINQIKETLKIVDQTREKSQKVDELMKKLDKDISKGNERYRRSPDGGYSHLMNGLNYTPKDAVYYQESNLKETIERYEKIKNNKY
mgnify:CR=1 FL=1